MSIKKLLKEGVTYNSLRKIFEECCSFLDFYETMKTYGIERKVSKVMALHFSGQGFQNQGARALSKLHEEKPTTQVSSEHQEDGKALQPDPPAHKPQPKMSAASNPPDAKSSNQVEAGEDWENEVTTTAPRTDFTLKCTTPTPLSMDVDDISSTQWLKTTSRESPRGKPQATIAHSHSEKRDSRNVEVTSKRLQGKARKADVRDRFSNSTSNAPKQSSERSGKLKRPLKESKQEGRMKKEPISSKRGSKNEGSKIKKIPLKSRDASQEHSDEKISEASVGSVSSDRISPTTEPGELPCEENSSFGECPLEKSELPATPDMDGDSSMTDVVHQFTSVFIGDIAILVPVENGVDADSNGAVFNESESHVRNQTEDAAITKHGKVVDNSRLGQLSQESLEKCDQAEAEATVSKPDKMVDNLQPNQESSTGNVVIPIVSTSFQSECGTSHRPLETHAQNQTEASVTEFDKVMDTSPLNLESSEGNAMMSSKLASNSRSEPGGSSHRAPETCGQYQIEEATVTSPLNLEQSPGSARISDQLVSSDRAEETNDSNNVNEDVTTSNNLTENVLDGTDHQDATLLSNGQDPACPVNSNSYHDETAIRVGFPWEQLQQMPCTSLPDSMSLASSDPVDQPMYGSFVMNQGLASHFVTTEDVNQASRDLQAELSSESSSTSGEQPVDLFSRQPPLGAERGYTPDAVQHQLSWLGNTSDGICQMSPGPGFSNYNQTSFPTFSNPYGTFYQAQQALPLLKPCYPSFAYHSHARPMIPPHMMQPPQQVFMPPFQYRNQVTFSNMAPAGVGFPSLPPPQFQPQMFPFLPVNGGYSCCPMSICGNPYEQSPQSLGATVDINNAVLTHPSNALSQVGPTVDDYRSLAMVSNRFQLSDEREESSSELSSSESSLELTMTPAASQMYDNSNLAQEAFPVQTENNSGFSMSLTYEDNQNETKGSWSENLSEYKNDGQVFNLAHLCYKEVSCDEVYVNKMKDKSCVNNSEQLFSQQLSEGQEDPVHKQIMILSREESAMAMGRRLSPDGSSMEGVCFDLPSDASSVQNLEKMSKVKSSSARHRPEEHCSYRPSDMKEKRKERRKDRSLSPKPQRGRGNRSRRSKGTQGSSVSVSSQKDLHQPASGSPSEGIIPNTRPDAQSVSSKNTYDSLGSNCGINSCQASQPKNHRRVRFSKEDVEHQSLETSQSCGNPRRANASISGQEKENVGINSVEEMSRLTNSGDQNMNDLEGSQTRSVDRSSTTTMKVEGERVHEDSRYKDRSQKHVEKRINTEIRPANTRTGNFRKRGFNDKVKRSNKEKQPVKVLSPVKKPETDTRTDKNNNSK